MATWKETLKKRWLLIVAYALQIVVPLAIIIELFVTNDGTPKVPAFLLIVGILYISFVSKIVKNKIKNLKEGVIKTLTTELNFLVPFFVVALLVYVAENLFVGFWKWLFVIVGCIVLGSLLKVIEFAVNKEFIYQQKIYALAKEQVDIDRAKEDLNSQLDEIKDTKVGD